MMSCERGKFPYSFFILLTQSHRSHVPKLTNFHIFIIPFPLNMTLFSKSPYSTAHIKINYKTRFSAKSQSCIQDHRNI